MKHCWMIVNRDSGSHDDALCRDLKDGLEHHGYRVDRTFVLPDDSLPEIGAAKAAHIDLMAIFTGDGTVNAAVIALEGWDGDLLILPGGTMNLLSRKLHGEGDPVAILTNALSGDARRVHLPVAEGHGLRSLVGIIAGPTAAWGNVREAIRQIDLRGLTESVPQALQDTLSGEPVSIAGCAGKFQAIFIDPKEHGLHASGINAGSPSELLAHGWAWLRGDFRDGPSTELTIAPSIKLQRKGAIELLVDGEQASAPSPCRFHLGLCGLNFIATRRK